MCGLNKIVASELQSFTSPTFEDEADSLHYRYYRATGKAVTPINEVFQKLRITLKVSDSRIFLAILAFLKTSVPDHQSMKDLLAKIGVEESVLEGEVAQPEVAAISL